VKFGFRWYMASTGTWTQRDTVDVPLDPRNANRYAFAGGDPIGSSDPTGLLSSSEKCGFAFLFIGTTQSIAVIGIIPEIPGAMLAFGC